MTQHIGIVACSAEGAALCYRTICAEGPAILGPHAHPEITMHTFPLSQYMVYIDKNDWEGVASLMIGSANKLSTAGAAFAICPDNTIHQSFDFVADKSPIPWLHIAEEVAKVATQKQYRKIGVLGTKYLMEGPVYPGKFDQAGIDYEIPTDDQRQRISQIIFDELVYGKFENASRNYFTKVIDSLREKGCDAVVLGCTEIPLLISQENSSIPVLDSTRLLARAALAAAVQQTAPTVPAGT